MVSDLLALRFRNPHDEDSSRGAGDVPRKPFISDVRNMMDIVRRKRRDSISEFRTVFVRSAFRVPRATFILAMSVALVSFAGPVSAYEPVTVFVDALCAKGYFDTAVEYLDELKTKSYVSDDVIQAILFHQGSVLMKQAAATPDAAVKARLFSAAAVKLKQFLASAPNSELAASASGRLATMKVEEARSLVAVALVAPKEDRDARLLDARQMFEQAREQLSIAEKAFTAVLDKMPKLFAPGEEDQKQRKTELAADLAETQLTAAGIDYELAKTYDPGSPDAKRYLNFAADKFSKISEEYRTRGVGLFARLWEGKCYQELGDRKRAMTAYQDLLDLPARSKELRTVRVKALRQAIEIWCSPEEKNYQDAMMQGDDWLATAGGAANDADALAVRYFTALAYQKQMATLGPKNLERKRLQQAALKLARAVARQPGEFKEQAAKLVTALGGAKEKDPDAAPKTFLAARDRGRESLEKMAAARMNRDVANETEDKEELALAEQQEKEAKAEAAQLLKLALKLDPAGSKIEDINPVRYYVCFFNYDEGNYLDAAVMGEYLAYHFPKSAEGRQAARIALASWVKVYSASPIPDRSFEVGKIARIAEFIIKTWPDQEEAIEASGTLLNFAILERDTAKVIEYLERIPADSPRRGDSELRAGQSHWSAYLRDARLPEDERPAQEHLEQSKTQAAEILQKGVERMKDAGQVSPTLVAAALSLAQILVDTGQPEKAIEWLENGTLGPLKLLNDGNEVVFASPQMPIEIYKLALRSYVAVQPPRLEDAEKVMNSLEEAVNRVGDAKASENLTMIYIALGRELQQQLEELRNSKKQKQLKAVSDGFESFLKRIVKRETGNTWSSLNWVAETHFSLGTGFDDGKAAILNAEAKRHYANAVEAYAAIVKQAEADKAFAPQDPNALDGVRLRMAVCQRKIGKHDDAIKTIVSVLKTRPMMLPAQVLGAETYQGKGLVDKDSYGIAILGGKDRDAKGQSIIWGWAKLSKMTQNQAKFVDTFHMARIRISECRFLYGMMIADKDKEKEESKRARTLTAAKDDMWTTYKLYPTLGGKARADEYNRLLVKIQKALGEKPIGLEEFRRRSAKADELAAKTKSTT